jgi:signal transduction histidine kinase
MDDEGTGTSERPTDARPAATERRTIVLIEDDAGDRTLVRRLLRGGKREYHIVEAATGAEGLARVREARPDCVLLDYHLPDMRGDELLDALQSDQGRLAPVLVYTGAEDDAAATSTLQRGAQDYLVKDGLTGPGLTRAIENAIEKFAIRRELDAQQHAAALQNRRLERLRDELQAKVVELADATRAKDRFLAVMSHEMRTPLNAILGYTDLLDMGLDGDLSPGQRQYLERMRVGSRHLLDLINDVLDLTRADARKLELDLRPVDLDAVLEEVVAVVGSRAAAKGIALQTEGCASEVPHVHADLQRLRQVLINLVDNAIKFTDEGSVTIRCRVSDSQRRVLVEVRDTGIGIDPSVLPLVFNEFYQASGELTRRHGGSGLGLAISQRLAELMGGELSAASEPGRGSVFTLSLLAADVGSALRPDDVAEHGALMAARGGTPQRVSPTSVCVVAFGENAAALAELEARVSPGVRLCWTTNATDVARLAREQRPALVVLDVGSAGGAAWAAAGALQDVPELAATAVLLLPSLSAAIPDQTSQVLDLGWVSLVPKPFTAAQLTHAVVAAAGSVRLARERSERSGAQVLVVDDDPDSRRVAARFLVEAGVRVREAPDGETALMEMRAHSPDVVVLDLMMPVLDGFGVLAAMRADPMLAGIPAVVLTAKSLSEAERQFLSRTAVRVLQKGEHRLADVAALVLRAAAASAGQNAER